VTKWSETLDSILQTNAHHVHFSTVEYIIIIVQNGKQNKRTAEMGSQIEEENHEFWNCIQIKRDSTLEQH
jgi:hypothetical protein